MTEMPFARRNEGRYEEDNRNCGRWRRRNDGGNPGGKEWSGSDDTGRK